MVAETLDSILAQTYTQWECIIVDDGSTDDSVKVVAAYVNKDKRFKLYTRPETYKKGGNTCRNYGLEKSKGIYINWFDSDDWMHPEFLAIKLNNLKDLDFVISTSVDWHEDGSETSIYNTSNKGQDISAYNFIKGTIHCITNDFMATRDSIADLRFNEVLKSGQEYNFISRYLCTVTNGSFILKVLSKRRVHPGSIQFGVSKSIKEDQNKYLLRTIENKYYLLEDLKTIGDKASIVYLVNSIINFSYLLAQGKGKIPFYSEIIRAIKKVKGRKQAYYYQLAILLTKNYGRGYRYFKKALQ